MRGCLAYSTAPSLKSSSLEPVKLVQHLRVVSLP